MKDNKKYLAIIPYLVTILVVATLFVSTKVSSVVTCDYTEVQQIIKEETVKEVNLTLYSTVIEVSGTFVKNDKTITFKALLPNTDNQNEELFATLAEKGTTTNITNPYKENVWLSLLAELLPTVLLGGLTFAMISKIASANGNSKAFEFSKSRARLESKNKVKFNDVAGCEEEKEEMAELISYLKNPKKFSSMGARIPKGILMVGSPGTGKTLLAKAVAGEADVPFYSISGSDFVEMFVGVGASRVRDMFKEAKKNSPCIVFIDEIDAVGRQRGAGLGGGNDEREQTLNQLLVEMDGIDENNGILIIAATNRPDVLDPALLRPGRFDRQITVSLPDKKGRLAILQVHARNKKFAADVDLEALASRTPGFSGADLENVLNEASILAVRFDHPTITMEDLDEAIDRTMGGPAKKSRKYSDKEKRFVATHEAGHTIVGLFCQDAEQVQKVTIIPRGMAGGYNLMTPKEDNLVVSTKKELMGQITGLLGGRVAEELILGEITTGASNDIERATKIAREMVSVYGMSSIGPVQYAKDDGNVFLGRDYTTNKAYSDKVAFEIDQEVRNIVDDCYKEATKLIKKHTKELNNIVDQLIARETLTKEDLDEIVFGKKKDVEQQPVKKTRKKKVAEEQQA